MNIYEILFTHYSPKDSETGIKRLLVADNDEEVYDYIKSEPKGIYNNWLENESLVYSTEKDAFTYEDGSESDEYFADEQGNPETFKQRMLRLKGEMFDEDFDLSDLYYGKTLYGWQLIQENATKEEINFVNRIYNDL